jgi:hypothetical protein
MKNQNQIKKESSRSSARAQSARQGRGGHSLAGSGAIFFESLYDDIREKSFDEAVCLFEALLELIKHHPGMEQEREALDLIVRGDRKLQQCQALKRSQALNN